MEGRKGRTAREAIRRAGKLGVIATINGGDNGASGISRLLGAAELHFARGAGKPCYAALITFKALTTQQPQYLSELIRYYTKLLENYDLVA